MIDLREIIPQSQIKSPPLSNTGKISGADPMVSGCANYDPPPLLPAYCQN